MLSEVYGVNAAGVWDEGVRTYPLRFHGIEGMNFESRLKQDLPWEVSRGHSTRMDKYIRGRIEQ